MPVIRSFAGILSHLLHNIVWIGFFVLTRLIFVILEGVKMKEFGRKMQESGKCAAFEHAENSGFGQRSVRQAQLPHDVLEINQFFLPKSDPKSMRLSRASFVS